MTDRRIRARESSHNQRRFLDEDGYCNGRNAAPRHGGHASKKGELIGTHACARNESISVAQAAQFM